MFYLRKTSNRKSFLQNIRLYVCARQTILNSFLIQLYTEQKWKRYTKF